MAICGQIHLSLFNWCDAAAPKACGGRCSTDLSVAVVVVAPRTGGTDCPVRICEKKINALITALTYHAIAYIAYTKALAPAFRVTPLTLSRYTNHSVSDCCM